MLLLTQIKLYRAVFTLACYPTPETGESGIIYSYVTEPNLSVQPLLRINRWKYMSLLCLIKLQALSQMLVVIQKPGTWLSDILICGFTRLGANMRQEFRYQWQNHTVLDTLHAVWLNTISCTTTWTMSKKLFKVKSDPKFNASFWYLTVFNSLRYGTHFSCKQKGLRFDIQPLKQVVKTKRNTMLR